MKSPTHLTAMASRFTLRVALWHSIVCSWPTRTSAWQERKKHAQPHSRNNYLHVTKSFRNWVTVGQEIPRILWNLMFQHSIRNSPPLLPILCHMNPVHTLTSCFFKAHNDIILSSMLRSSTQSLPFCFPTKIPGEFLTPPPPPPPRTVFAILS
jgi:hypothetical protein